MPERRKIITGAVISDVPFLIAFMCYASLIVLM